MAFKRLAFTSAPAMSSALLGRQSGAALPFIQRHGVPIRASTSFGHRRLVMSVATAGDKKKKKSKSRGEPRARREKKSSESKALAAALEKYEPVIGVEVHVQLATKTKAYCACPTKAVRTPNTNVCPVCMGHPGALPVLNGKAVELAAQASMALECEVSPESRFDRKNYFYSDTAKNYQITQQYFPIAEHGCVTLATSGKKIGITRLHMEEDSAKMSHEGGEDTSGRLGDSTYSLVDFNRGGMPLIEIVSDPDMRSGVEAAEYGQELQRILRYIGASDCNMQDGSLRLDVNVSIRVKGTEKFGTKVELKNLNSFSSVQRSVEFEIERQAGILDNGGTVVQETRLWDENENSTKTMRVKEEAADYRYFPEPDLPPLYLDESVLTRLRECLPELPTEKRARYSEEYGLSTYDAFLLADDVSVASYFESAIGFGADPKQCANWIMGDITKVLKFEKLEIGQCKLSASNLAELVNLIEDGTISGKIAKDLVVELVVQGGQPSTIVEERNLMSIKSPEKIAEFIEAVMSENATEVEAYRGGKTKLFGFFVGKVMASTGGRADPKIANEVLRSRLDG